MIDKISFIQLLDEQNIKNKKNKFFLFTCLESTLVNLKEMNKKLQLGNISFAKEEHLKKILNVKPGSVTPFGLINDDKKIVKFFFDNKLNDFDSLNFHPLVNTSTINIKKEDFHNFFIKYDIKINLLNFNSIEIIND